MLAQRWLPFLLLAAVTVAGGCSEPCTDLAHEICRCKRTETEQQSCITQVDSDTNQASEDEQQQCNDLLESCNCHELEVGNLAACGLAEPGNELGVAGSGSASLGAVE